MKRITRLPAQSSMRRSLFERLEDRRLMSVTFGTNLIVDPGAESSSTSAPGWTSNGTPGIVAYGTNGGFPTATDPGPTGTTRGKNFFTGGVSGESDLFQTIDLSSIASTIDAKQAKFSLSAYLGGFLTQEDQASMFVNFQTSTKSLVSQTSIGPVTAENRNDLTGLLLRSTSGTIPATTRFAQIQLHFDPVTGGYNDGYADNTSFIVTSASTTGTVSGTVYNDLNGDGVKSTGEVGLGGVKVFFDTNGNGKLDTGETKIATTASNGTYSFTGVAAGSYKISEVVPSTYRSVGTFPLSITLAGGATATANFYDTQTVLISGSVFNDANGDKIQQSTETGLAGVVVYLDFNNNGQLDSFELKTTTDSKGNYKFIVPFGTYVVREVVPTGKVQTTPTGGFTLTLAKGATSTTDKFGDK